MEDTVHLKMTNINKQFKSLDLEFNSLLIEKKPQGKKKSIRIARIVFSIFDTWLSIASFSFLHEIIQRISICKYWSVNTYQHLQKVKRLMIGVQQSKIPFFKWFKVLHCTHSKIKLQFSRTIDITRVGAYRSQEFPFLDRSV